MFFFLPLPFLAWAVSHHLAGSVSPASPPASCGPCSPSALAVATGLWVSTAFRHLPPAFAPCIYPRAFSQGGRGRSCKWEFLHPTLMWSQPSQSVQRPALLSQAPRNTEKAVTSSLIVVQQTEQNNRGKRWEDNKQTPSHEDVLTRQISDAEQNASPLKWHFYI